MSNLIIIHFLIEIYRSYIRKSLKYFAFFAKNLSSHMSYVLLKLISYP